MLPLVISTRRNKTGCIMIRKHNKTLWLAFRACEVSIAKSILEMPGYHIPQPVLADFIQMAVYKMENAHYPAAKTIIDMAVANIAETPGGPTFLRREYDGARRRQEYGAADWQLQAWLFKNENGAAEVPIRAMDITKLLACGLEQRADLPNRHAQRRRNLRDRIAGPVQS